MDRARDCPRPPGTAARRGAAAAMIGPARARRLARALRRRLGAYAGAAIGTTSLIALVAATPVAAAAELAYDGPPAPSPAQAARLAATAPPGPDWARAAPGPAAARDPEWTGERIMRETIRRHEQFPYVYERQQMVLSDADDNRSVRRLRRFSRIEDDGTVKLLLVFDDPEEIRGVALLARRAPDGASETGVYLPAFGPRFKRPSESGLGERFLGTDFAVQDLTPEVIGDYRYLRVGVRRADDVEYFVVEAYPRNARIERETGYGLRRLYVRKDRFVVTRTDYYDRQLRLSKRLVRHDLQRVYGESWRANMIVVTDEREGHRTLLKIVERVYSRDYVPAGIFEPEYLLANRHLPGRAAAHARAADPGAGPDPAPAPAPPAAPGHDPGAGSGTGPSGARERGASVDAS